MIKKGKSWLDSIVTVFINENTLVCVFSAWFFTSSILSLFTIKFFSKSHIALFLGLFLILFSGIFIFDRKSKSPIIPISLGISSFMYALIIITNKSDLYVAIGVVIVLAIVGVYLIYDDKMQLSKIKITKGFVKTVIGVFALFFVFYVGGVTVFRYLNYGTTTYDLGIFSQMFHNMKETGLPNVSCERNGLYSHFQVHVSPIFYLLLPGYMIFPSPIYLQIAQAVVVASAVIPIYLIAKHFELSNKVTLCICIAFLMYPALGGSCMYDIHENLFLAPLILWLFYFVEKEKTPLIIVFSMLVLLVKEDAFFYVICVGLYLIFFKKKVGFGIILSIIALEYFLVVSLILEKYGFGVMAGRLGNIFLPDGKFGIFGMIVRIILDPSVLITEVFTEEKFKYFLWMFVPVAFTSILSKKPSRLILLIPLLLFNLISNYGYMHSIYFQYHFATTAFMFFLVILNIKDYKHENKRYVSYLMAVASIVMFIAALGRYSDNFTRYYNNKEQIEKLNSYLEEIPEEASVQSSGFYLPKLSNRSIIYDVHYNFEGERHDTKYVVFDLRGVESGILDAKKYFLENGYVEAINEKNLVLILENSDVDIR